MDSVDGATTWQKNILYRSTEHGLFCQECADQAASKLETDEDFQFRYARLYEMGNCAVR